MKFIKLQIDERRSVTFIVKGLIKKRVYVYWFDAEKTQPQAIRVPFVEVRSLDGLPEGIDVPAIKSTLGLHGRW